MAVEHGTLGRFGALVVTAEEDAAMAAHEDELRRGDPGRVVYCEEMAAWLAGYRAQQAALRRGELRPGFADGPMVYGDAEVPTSTHVGT